METLTKTLAERRVNDLMKNIAGKNINSRAIEKAAKKIAGETKTNLEKVRTMISEKNNK
jgi:ribosomal protein S3AE